MTRFVYHYLDDAGRRRLAWMQAVDAAACCTLLAAQGIYPIFLCPVRLPMGLEARQSPRQLALFFRQLAAALASGVPMLEALRYMADEQNGERQRAFVERVEEGVLAGLTFSQALAREKSVAPMISQWIAVGEKQGRLASVLEEVHLHLEERVRLKKRMQQQLLYPFMVLAAVLLLGAFLTVVVMPALASQFVGVTELPAVMRAMLLISSLLRSDGWVLVLLLVAVLVLGVYLRYSPNVQWRQRLKHGVMHWPFLRQFALLQVFVPFARLFGQLLRSGVSVGEAMQELQRYFSASLFADDVRAIAVTMAQGGSLSQALAEAPFVPALACQMLRHGERYGRLPEALCDAATYYETILFEKLGLWLRFIEPLAIVLLGILVLIMAMGLFLPVLESYQSLLVS